MSTLATQLFFGFLAAQDGWRARTTPAPFRRVLLKEAWASSANRKGPSRAGRPWCWWGWWQKLDDRSFIPLRSLVPEPRAVAGEGLALSRTP